MRTTITLDDDVAVALERLRKSRDAALKEIVNELLREGLNRVADRPRRRARYVTGVTDLGAARIGRVDNVAETLAIAEGEAFR